jgi:hypothetical protein
MAGVPPFEGQEANTCTRITCAVAPGSMTVVHDWICKAKRCLTAAECECASARTGAHRLTTRRVRASRVRRPKPRAECGSRDRGSARRLRTTPRPPSPHPRPVSRNQPITALRRMPPPSGRQVPAGEPLRVPRCHVARMESLLPLARTGARFLANPPEMSRKAVARVVPFSGYRHLENIETLKSRFGEPLFRGV